MDESTGESSWRASTGVEGLDALLGGGLPRNTICLAQGAPGTGRTTLSLQFLLAGVRAGERVLYATLAQTRHRLEEIARSHGWSLEGVEVYEDSFREPDEQTVLHTAEVELGEMVDALLEAVRRVNPDRVVIDSIAEIRNLAMSPHRYRRELVRLRRQFDGRCTVLCVDLDLSQSNDAEIQSLADGIIEFEQKAPSYGDVQRRLKITKMRGLAYYGGYHNYRIRTGGHAVYTRPTAKNPPEYLEAEEVRSGVEALDALLGGGLQKGTSCVLLGAAGTGKTSLAILYAFAVTQRGEKAAVFAFDERPQTMLQRAEGVGIPLRRLVEEGQIRLQQIDTGELTPGEFVQLVRTAVEDDGAKVVVIDTLTSYFHSMPQDQLLLPQMHELLTYTARQGVLTILTVAQHGIMGTTIDTRVDISYVADAVLLLRHFDDAGTIRRTVSVIVKRYGVHAHTVHELAINQDGVQIGPPIRNVSGILAGNPVYHGSAGQPEGGGGRGENG